MPAKLGERGGTHSGGKDGRGWAGKSGESRLGISERGRIMERGPVADEGSTVS